MKIGVFSVIPWRFLDQRVQVIAKYLAREGHDTIYIGTFPFAHCSPDKDGHDWEAYRENSWCPKEIEKPKSCSPLILPNHHWSAPLMNLQREFIDNVKNKISDEKIELGIVIDPLWGKILKDLNIPFVYDHVDDTHHMEHVRKEDWFSETFCEKTLI